MYNNNKVACFFMLQPLCLTYIPPSFNLTYVQRTSPSGELLQYILGIGYKLYLEPCTAESLVLTTTTHNTLTGYQFTVCRYILLKLSWLWSYLLTIVTTPPTPPLLPYQTVFTGAPQQSPAPSN